MNKNIVVGILAAVLVIALIIFGISMVGQMSDLKVNLIDKTGKSSKLKDDLQEKDLLLVQKEGKIKDLEKDLSQLSDAKQLKAALVNSQQMIHSINKKLKEAKGEQEASERENRTLKVKVQNGEMKVKRLAEDLMSVNQKIQNIEDFQDSKPSNNQELTTLKKELRTNKNEAENIKKDLETYKERYRELAVSTKTLNNTISNLEKQLSSKDRQLEILKTKLGTKDSTSEKTTNNRTLKNVQDQVIEKNKEILTLKNQLQNLQRDAYSKNNNPVASNEAITLRNKLIAKDQEVAYLKVKLDKLQETYATVQIQNNMLSKDIKDLQANLKTKYEETKSLTKQAQEFKEKYEVVLAEKDNYQKAIVSDDKESAKLNELKESLKNIEEEKQDIESKFNQITISKKLIEQDLANLLKKEEKIIQSTKGYKDKLIKLSGTLYEKEEKIRELEEDLDKEKAKVDNGPWQEQLREANDAKYYQERELSYLKIREKELSSLNNNLQKQLTDLSGELLDKERRLREFETIANDPEGSNDREKTILRGRVAEQKETLEKANNIYSKLKGQLKGLADVISNKEDQLNQREDELRAYKDEVIALKSELTMLKGSVVENERMQILNQDRLSEASQLNQRLQGDLDDFDVDSYLLDDSTLGRYSNREGKYEETDYSTKNVSSEYIEEDEVQEYSESSVSRKDVEALKKRVEVILNSAK